MGNYYCMMAGLPEIDLSDTKPGFSIKELREQCDASLSKGDRKLLEQYFFLLHDCKNLVKLLQNTEAETTEWGNYSKEQLQDLLSSAQEWEVNDGRFPAFMSDFARAYTDNKDKKGYFADDEVVYKFYNHAITTCRNAFVRQWYQLNLDITNLLTAILARKQGWNVGDYIQGEGNVQDLIRTSKSKDFDLGREYDFVNDVMKIAEETDPVKKEKMIDAFKWLWLDEQTFFNAFSIEAVFAYLCKLEMQYRWAKLDVEQGKETFKQIIENLRGEARVPEEFTTHTINR